ncbi:NAD(P)H-dependent oxidoreductase [Acinetobacter nectaris]|uniref:NAD(P)H-dependent oxidoreductase n=1 Tax=Acinetobacter nectaris TaxID=1219382 RepID=UPI001F3C1BDF|nr:NAD(P)H-dependent oxidoreductase [Acinetobacter nectaris]MCF8998662.1 NAD(P)H-dependent oxidoreductase [Acinetobacter nectaris]MCF9026424.1 NAD(P)H-dependent oxidoreductase [Acinetobacter nectaris]
MNTLVIVSHPYADQSKITQALEQSIANFEHVTVRNLEKLYGNNPTAFDIKAEQAVYEGIERVVFLFPIHWFNITPMLKAYLNEVWTYGWAFGPEGTALKNKEMLIVSSAGASEHTYSKEGLIQSTVEDIFIPMKATALYVGMKYLPPLTLHNAMAITDEQLLAFKESFISAIKTV